MGFWSNLKGWFSSPTNVRGAAVTALIVAAHFVKDPATKDTLSTVAGILTGHGLVKAADAPKK